MPLVFDEQLGDYRFEGEIPPQGRILADGTFEPFSQTELDAFANVAAEIAAGTYYTVAEAIAAIDKHLNAQAQSLGYESIVTAVTYASSSHPKFGPEGRAFLAWRDAVWSWAYEYLEQVQTGQVSKPAITEIPNLVPAMPVIDYQNG